MDKLDKDSLRALYGGTYAEALDVRDHSRRLRRLVGMIDFDRSSEVVDFGCGNGALLDVLFQNVRSYTGVDFSQAFIDLALNRRQRIRASNATFECASIEEFCARHNERFDLAFALDFSEHVYDDEWVAILEWIRSSLKPSGRLVLHTPNADFFLEIMKARNFVLRQSREHIAIRGLDHNTRLLRQAGFSVRRTELIPHYNALRLLHPLSYVPVVGRFLKARIFIEAGASS